MFVYLCFVGLIVLSLRSPCLFIHHSALSNVIIKQHNVNSWKKYVRLWPHSTMQWCKELHLNEIDTYFTTSLKSRRILFHFCFTIQLISMNKFLNLSRRNKSSFERKKLKLRYQLLFVILVQQQCTGIVLGSYIERQLQASSQSYHINPNIK